MWQKVQSVPLQGTIVGICANTMTGARTRKRSARKTANEDSLTVAMLNMQLLYSAPGGIRTPVARRQRVYSASYLTALPPALADIMHEQPPERERCVCEPAPCVRRK